MNRRICRSEVGVVGVDWQFNFDIDIIYCEGMIECDGVVLVDDVDLLKYVMGFLILKQIFCF